MKGATVRIFGILAASQVLFLQAGVLWHVDGFQHRVMPGGSGRAGRTALQMRSGFRELSTLEIPSGETGAVTGFWREHRNGWMLMVQKQFPRPVRPEAPDTPDAAD
jgi:hypothetical protein